MSTDLLLNILSYLFLSLRRRGDGLFLKCCVEVSDKYKDIQFNEMYLDKACLLVSTVLL